MISRIGGEEFMITLPVNLDVTPELIKEKVLKRYHDMLKDLNRTGRTDEFVQQTISIGCIIIDNEFLVQTSDYLPETVMRLADELLYVSKRNGRNQSTVKHARETFTV